MFYFILIFSINHKLVFKCVHNKWMSAYANRWSDSVLWYLEVDKRSLLKDIMLCDYLSSIGNHIPELYTTLTNGSSITVWIFTFFFTIFFSAFPLFGLNQMFLMQELIPCKHSDILVVINQLKIYLAESHQHVRCPGYWKREKVNLCGTL